VSTNILLSIVIPAYGYAQGVQRILSILSDDPTDEIEIIISDDSRDEQVCQIVNSFSTYFQGKLRYIRNKPSLGAINNWNFLLEKASGEYVLLLHHDEYPLGRNFQHRVLGLLNSSLQFDVFVMQCILFQVSEKYSQPHLPRIISKLIIKYMPGYLFKRNVIGPPSCIIVRRRLYPKFDVNLRWLVDVEAYFRLRQVTEKWSYCKDITIGSLLGRDDSITASIKDNLKILNEQEIGYLEQKYPGVTIWLSNTSHRILKALEVIIWVLTRVTTRFYYLVAFISRKTHF